jgi:hypothetical protein
MSQAERAKVEASLGLGKVGKRTPTWEFNQAPSHWRKTLKAWAIVAMTFIGVWIVIGVGAGIVERIWP